MQTFLIKYVHKHAFIDTIQNHIHKRRRDSSRLLHNYLHFIHIIAATLLSTASRINAFIEMPAFFANVAT